MPILNWLTRDEDIQATKSVPYRLLEEAKRGQDLNCEFCSQPGRGDLWPKTYNSKSDPPISKSEILPRGLSVLIG